MLKLRRMLVMVKAMAVGAGVVCRPGVEGWWWMSKVVTNNLIKIKFKYAC